MRTQHIATTPAGWRVRSKRAGGHVLRIAFPPGRRQRGSGRVVEVLHPKRENPGCEMERANPEQLLIFGLGNPARGRYEYEAHAGSEVSPSFKTKRQARAWLKSKGVQGRIVKTERVDAPYLGHGPRYSYRREANRQKRRNAAGGFGNHRPGCPCAFCDRAAKLQSGELAPPALPNRRRSRNASAEYERALAKYEEARKKFAAVRARYRGRQVGDDEYLAAKRVYDAATREFDAAHAREAKRNPKCGARFKKRGAVTDRALRYRANSPECRPEGPRVCAFCGSRRNVEVHHLDGREETTRPENLAWACRSCNTAVGRQLQAAGIGRLTAQYNPSEGAQSLAQWVTAVTAMKGQNDAMTVPAAVKMIRATPASRRSSFANQIWKRRRRPRRNPDDTQQAVQLFQAFHGKDPAGVVEKQEPAIMREDYTAIGPLEYLKIKSPLGELYQVDFEGDGVILASSPDGRQLYCIGGNQNLAGVLDADSLQKDLIDLGECVQVQYMARKVHTNFEPTSWHHEFGEKSGERPELIYDKLKKRIFFAGGAYFIDSSAEISPGIEN